MPMADKRKATRKDRKMRSKEKARKKVQVEWGQNERCSSSIWRTSRGRASTPATTVGSCMERPKDALQGRLNGAVKGYQHVSGRNLVLMKEREVELIKTLAKWSFLLRRLEIQALACQYEEKNKMTGFSVVTKKAGQYWFNHFLPGQLG